MRISNRCVLWIIVSERIRAKPFNDDGRRLQYPFRLDPTQKALLELQVLIRVTEHHDACACGTPCTGTRTMSPSFTSSPSRYFIDV